MKFGRGNGDFDLGATGTFVKRISSDCGRTRAYRPAVATHVTVALFLSKIAQPF
jgi:hypothetical protein